VTSGAAPFRRDPLEREGFAVLGFFGISIAGMTRPTLKFSTLFLLLLSAAALFAQTPTQIPVTGHFGGVGHPASGNFGVKFQLTYCGANLPRVFGIFNPVQTNATFPVDPTTGLISGQIWPNDVLNCGGTLGGTRYNVTAIVNGIPQGQPVCYQVLTSAGTFNLDTAQPCVQVPPPPPPPGFGDYEFNNLTLAGLLSAASADFAGEVTAPQISAKQVSGLVDITRYGATCNGATDDHAAIQAAINANPFSTIVVPTGCTGINLGSTGIVFTDGQTFDGANILISYAGTGKAVSNTPGTVANGVTLRNIRINMAGSTVSAMGAVLIDCEYCKIENFNIHGGAAGYTAAALITDANCCTISSKIERGRVDGMVLIQGADGGHQVTDSTIDTVYVSTATPYSYVMNFALNPVLVDSIAESFSSAAFFLENDEGTAVILGSDVEGGGTNIFSFGSGNFSLSVDGTVSLVGWSGLSKNFSTGTPPIGGSIISDRADLSPYYWGNGLRSIIAVPFDGSSNQFVEIGAQNNDAVNGGAIYKSRWITEGNAAGQLLKLRSFLNGGTTLDALSQNSDGSLSLAVDPSTPLGIATKEYVDTHSNVQNVIITVGTAAIPANSCAVAASVTMPGVTTASTFSITATSDISATAGWNEQGTGKLYFSPWPTANTLNYRVCNPTAVSITPGAVTTWNGSAH
jgi:hypothetical protein